MQVKLNERLIYVDDSETVISVVREHYREDDYDIILYNSFPLGEDRPLNEFDEIIVFKKGVCPPRDELEYLLTARHTPHVHDVLKTAVVAVAGLGGLGSMTALNLARTGLGKLILVDFDIVEPSNLNRQQYFIDQIGMKKTDALSVTIARINPFIGIEAHDCGVTAENAENLFREASVVVEAFDNPSDKEMLVRAVINNMTDKYIVAGSGMAGYGPNNDIVTERVGRLFLCGDGVSEAGPGEGLMAPRVGICASHQANQVVRILLGSGLNLMT